MEENKQRNKERLFYGSIIFGATLPIGFFIIIHFANQIEFDRQNASLGIDILLWLLEWTIILFGGWIPWITWKKLVKPYKDF